MNNTINKLFFTLTVLTIIPTVHAAYTQLPTGSVLYTKNTKIKDPATTIIVQPSSPCKLYTMLAFMKMQVPSRHAMLGFIAYKSKHAASWAAKTGYEIFQNALKDVIKDKMKFAIKKAVPFLDTAAPKAPALHLLVPH